MIMRVMFGIVLAFIASSSMAQSPRMAAVDAVIATSPHFAGVAAVSRGGQTVHSASYGVRDRVTGAAHSPDEVFRWASVSKMVTAIVVFQEVDKGTIALDAPLTTYLPTSRVQNADRITIRHLLGHRSGLAEQADFSTVLPDGTLADQMEYCRKTVAEPGSTFLYNNCDTIILGQVLEAATDTPFLMLVNARLAPIDVTLSLPDGPLVEAYMNATTPEDPVYPSGFGPSGGLYGTAADMLAIDNAFMDGTLMSAESRAIMLKGDPASGYAALSVWSYEPDLKSCLGKTRLIERYGEINGVQVRNLLLPDKDVAVVLYANDRRVEFGEIWRGEGFAIDVLRAAACGPS